MDIQKKERLDDEMQAIGKSEMLLAAAEAGGEEVLDEINGLQDILWNVIQMKLTKSQRREIMAYLASAVEYGFNLETKIDGNDRLNEAVDLFNFAD
jgi:hypothetical protein